MKIYAILVIFALSTLLSAEPIYQFNPNASSEFTWTSSKVAPGKSATICETQGEGVIERIWITFDARNPDLVERIHSLFLKIYWDDSEAAAVEAPLYDFFNQPFGPQSVKNAFATSSGEKMTFCFTLPMPFKKSARVELKNDGENQIRVWYEFCIVKKSLPEDSLYFHTQFHTVDSKLEKAAPISVLKAIQGKGRYLGMHVSAVVPNPDEKWSWYHRKVNFQIDGESENSGENISYGSIDDFTGSGWWSLEEEREAFEFPYYGRHHVSHIENGSVVRVALYRYFVNDVIWFKKNISVSLGLNKRSAEFWRILSYYYLDTPGRLQASD